MSHSTVYMLDVHSVAANAAGPKEYDLSYSGLTSEQLQQVAAAKGTGEVRLSRDQVVINQARLSEDQMLRAAEQGGELTVLIAAKPV
jgi:hypothetical protein